MLGKDVGEVTGDVSLSRGLLGRCAGVGLAGEDQVLLEDVLDCLADRLAALDSALGRRCQHMRARMQELTAYQVRPTLHTSRSWWSPNILWCMSRAS